MNVYVAWAVTIFSYLVAPFKAFINLILTILTPVWYLVYVLWLPFSYIGQFFAYLFAYPLRFLGTLETLYIYLSTAALIGLFFGGFLFFSTNFLYNILRLDESQDPIPAKRTVADFRAERRKKKKKGVIRLSDKDSFPTSTPSMLSPASTFISPSTSTLVGEHAIWPGARKGLYASSQTILEEEDSEDYF